MMPEVDKSKRSFFKKMSVALGFITSASAFTNLVSNRYSFTQAINDNNALDVKKQKHAWLKIQWVPMSERDKKQMLDEILEAYNKDQV